MNYTLGEEPHEWHLTQHYNESWNKTGKFLLMIIVVLAIIFL